MTKTSGKGDADAGWSGLPNAINLRLMPPLQKGARSQPHFEKHSADQGDAELKQADEQLSRPHEARQCSR